MSTFIHISEASTIALHSLALIARSREKLNTGKLAEMTLFSRSHLAKVLHILVKHSYLSSLRGPHGGFTLKRDPRSISLLEVYELMEGELERFQCAITCNDCYFDACLFGDHPQRFAGEFREYLQGKSVYDFNMKKPQ